MNADFSIYLMQWGCYADEMRYVCESNKNGMVCATFRTYQQAVDWCEKKGLFAQLNKSRPGGNEGN